METAEKSMPVVSEEHIRSLGKGKAVTLDQSVQDALVRGEFWCIDWLCGDGRERRIGIQRFGGSFGYMILMTGALIEHLSDNFRLEYLDVLFDVIKEAFRDKLSYHTDSNHAESCLGCGFLKHSLYQSIADYGLTQQAAEKLRDFLVGIPKVVLEGDHEELGVLLVEEPVVISKGADQLFVVHRRIDNDVILHLVSGLAKSGKISGLVPQMLNLTAMQRRDKNISVTATKLGVDNKPVAIL